MTIATSSVEFSFNNIMHRQIDGVAMGSPLGPALANIFVGFHERRLFKSVKKPWMYFRYVDDTFICCKDEDECNNLFSSLNSLHPALRFTMEKEQNNCLPFLDVLVEKNCSSFETSIYRKATFSGQYVHWNSFSPKKRKISLIHTLVHRALSICSKNKVQEELENIRNILSTNGYPDDVVSTSISKKLRAFDSARKFGPKKCPVYIPLPWLGPVSQRLGKQIVTSVSNCYNSVKTNVIFMTRKIFPGIQKDVLPALHSSNIIYLFRCDCDIVAMSVVRPNAWLIG